MIVPPVQPLAIATPLPRAAQRSRQYPDVQRGHSQP